MKQQTEGKSVLLEAFSLSELIRRSLRDGYYIFLCLNNSRS